MSIFDHHIYEYKKGLRGLVLHTVPSNFIEDLRNKLDKQSISYVIRELDNTNCNVFFGEELCVEVVKQFGNRSLNQLTSEEDFMLGIMLGYSRLQQCQRYLLRKQKAKVFLKEKENLLLRRKEVIPKPLNNCPI
ncbi:MAG: DUF2023 family protein [Candidatus Omnitrophica bacterium]|nr:DUF2023 family protein [Candidatus Omnitrophota bacterium]